MKSCSIGPDGGVRGGRGPRSKSPKVAAHFGELLQNQWVTHRITALVPSHLCSRYILSRPPRGGSSDFSCKASIIAMLIAAIPNSPLYCTMKLRIGMNAVVWKTLVSTTIQAALTEPNISQNTNVILFMIWPCGTGARNASDGSASSLAGAIASNCMRCDPSGQAGNRFNRRLFLIVSPARH